MADVELFHYGAERLSDSDSGVFGTNDRQLKNVFTKAWWQRKHFKETTPRWVLGTSGLVAYICCCLLFLLVFLLILFLAIIPAVVQSNVDDSNLVFDRIALSESASTKRGINLVVNLSATGKITDAGSNSATLDAFDLSTYWNNGLLGKLAMPEISINGGEDTPFNINSHFTIADLGFFSQEFGKTLVETTSIAWHLKGKPDVNAIGLQFSSVDFDKHVALRAFDLGPPYRIILQRPDIVNATANGLHLRLNITVLNPSIFSVTLDSVTLHVLTEQGTKVAEAVVDNFFLDIETHGYVNNMIADVFYEDPTNQTQRVDATSFLSNFLCRLEQNITLAGQNETSALKLVLANIFARALLPGLERGLINSVKITNILGVLNLFDPSISVSLNLTNVFSVPYAVRTIDMQIYLEKDNINIGHLTQDLSGNPIVIDPQQSETTQSVTVSLKGLGGAINALTAFTSGGGKTNVTVSGALGVTIGSAYSNTLNYFQYQIPTYLFA